MAKPRVAIVGAGIVGLFMAVEAAEKGYDVVVYEANRLGYGASGHNAGVIHVIQQPFRSIKSRLALLGNRMHEVLSGEIGYALMETEALLVYTNSLETLYSRIAALYLNRAIRGFNVRLVDKGYVRDSCPDVSSNVRGAIAVSGYKTAIPMNVLRALERYAEGLGVDIREGWKVDGLKSTRDAVELYSKQVEEYNVAIIAAGGDTARLARTAGLTPPSQVYAKGVMVEAKVNCNSIIAPLRSRYRGKHTKGGAIIPWPDGRVIMGPTFKLTLDPWDTKASREEAYEVIERFKWLIGDVGVENVYAGTRIINKPIDDFIVQRLKRIIALYGIDSPGYTAAPALAKLIIESIKRIKLET